MIAPAQTLTLLAAIIMVGAIASLVWMALAWAARITPRASLMMAGANLASSASLALHALRGVLPDLLTHRLSDLLAVLSFALLGTAAQAVYHRHPPWRATALMAACTGVLLTLLPYEGDLRWPARVVNAGCAVLCLTAGIAVWRQLRAIDVRRTPARLAMPLLLIGALMAARGLETFINPGRTPDMRLPTPFNLAFLWAALVLTLVQNSTLAFLVLMRLIQRIERLLERDALTDTLNRRAFDRALADAHAWLKRGRGYALVMIDMDRFKQLNDTLGHAAGDAALRQMVRDLQPCLRAVDRFGRLGGEEFCVLLPDTDIAGAALVAERMRALVEATPLRWLEQDWPLSASFGITEAERNDADGGTVLARADAAMYRAKGQGRNVVQP
jgi:diguanylate cyclase (GGDEF)-like protein